MHRLKKWFGIKDVDIPATDSDPEIPPQAIENPVPTVGTVQNSDASQNSTNNSTETSAAPNPALELIRPLGGDQITPFFTNMELWARQYVPLKPDQCLGCKLVTTTVLLGGIVFNIRLISSVKKSKEMFPHTATSRNIRLFLLSFSGFLGSLAYYNWFNTGIFSPMIEGESSEDRWNRLLNEDMEAFKKIFTKFSGKKEEPLPADSSRRSDNDKQN